MSVVNNPFTFKVQPENLLSSITKKLDADFEITENTYLSQKKINKLELLIQRKSNGFNTKLEIILLKDNQVELSSVLNSKKLNEKIGKIVILNSLDETPSQQNDNDFTEYLSPSFTDESLSLAIRFLLYRIEAEAEKNIINKRFSSLLNGLDDVIFSLDVDTLKLLYINDTAERILGISPEVLAKDSANIINYIYPDDIPLFTDAKRILQQKGRFEIVFRFLDKDKNIRWAEGRIKLMKSGNNKRYEGLVTEITHKKIAEDKLWSTQLRLSLILKYLPNVVLYETGAGHEYISDNIYRLLGYTAEEFLQDRDTFRKIIHPDDELVAESNIVNWHKSKNPEILKLEFRAKHKMGHYIWLEDYLVKVNSPNSKSFMAGILVDITQRKKYESDLLKYKEMLEKRVLERTQNLEQANKKLQSEIKIRIETEDRLMKSEAIYRLLSSNIPKSAVFLIDSNHHIYIAEGKELIEMNLMSTDLEGKKVSEILTEDQYNYLEPGLKSLLQKKPFRLESKYLGEYYLINFIPLEVKEPESLLGIVMIHNISDIKKTQIELKTRAEELMRSNADLEQFAYVTSHDLKEPLRMISSYIQIINKKYVKQLDSEAEEFFSYITESVKRLHNLLDDLLKFSRVSRPSNTRTLTDLNEVFHIACKNLELKVK
ncbi:MAG: PAS domain S-box protein, partial [Chitinophagaceae bacterium]